MLDSIRRLMGSTPSKLSAEDAFKQLNTLAPLKSTQRDEANPENKKSSFVCREAVLDRKEKIAGYEFAHGRDLQSRMLEASALIRRVYDDTMLRNLAPLGVNSQLGERYAFIRLSVSSLKNPLLKTLAHARTVVMITPDKSSETDLPEIRENLQHLNKIGVKHGWTIGSARPDLLEFLHKADFIEVQALALDGLQLKQMSQDLRTANSAQLLIASELQTLEDFNVCYQCNFNYFMGPFVSSRDNWHPAKSEINRLKVFEALNMIRNGSEFDAIADCLRNDPILTFKLLRYINSPGIGLQQKINEIQQALMLLGREKFYRWLSLLLFDFKQPGFRENVLQEQALTRARFMELLAGQGRVPDNAGQLFMTGLFSLMDVLTGQALAEVIKQVALPEDVAAAINGQPGALHDALMLGIAVEALADADIARTAEQCGLEANDVVCVMLEAVAWTQQVVAVGE
jgi:EAL and modified HD-GYP domain-containing signal transduction protein